jgi:hypothetical protein
MDLLNSSLVLYLMIGTGIGFAVYLSSPCGAWVERGFRVLTAVVFWPLYVPLLVQGVPKPRVDADPPDELARPIAQVEAELRAALRGVDHGADEMAQLDQFHAVWSAYAERIREMDRLLQVSEHTAALTGAGERWQQSEQARQRNLEGIRRLRERFHNELMGTLAWVRELVSMLHLARFTGAPATRARELLDQIAVAVRSLAEGRTKDASSYRAGEPKLPLAASRSLNAG